MRDRRILACLTSLVLLGEVSCEAADALKLEPLLVYCAAGLRPPMEVLGKAYTTQSGREVKFHFTGSACLLPQAKLTELGDLYCPAEEFYLQQAVERGLIYEWQSIAAFTPVIAVPKGNPKKVAALKDLGRPGLRVGLADPKAAAVGKTSKAMLETAGLWAAVSKNVVTYTATVNELGNALKIGGVEAGIVWDAVASWYPEDLDVVPIEGAKKWSAAICLGVMKGTRQLKSAKDFFHFVKSPYGEAVFRRFGFSPAPPPLATPRHMDPNRHLDRQPPKKK